MADHSEVEYATAPGNDYAEHEATYQRFIHMTVVMIIHVINTVLALAIVGVMGHWPTAVAVFLIASAAAAHGLMSGSKTSSYIAFGLALVAFGISAAG